MRSRVWISFFMLCDLMFLTIEHCSSTSDVGSWRAFVLTFSPALGTTVAIAGAAN